jgi:hypothetical protein
VKSDNQTCRPRACRKCRQSNGLGMQPGKVAGQLAGRQQRVQELGLGGVGWTLGKKGIGAMRGRESRQPNVSATSLPKVPSEERVMHVVRKG